MKAKQSEIDFAFNIFLVNDSIHVGSCYQTFTFFQDPFLKRIKAIIVMVVSAMMIAKKTPLGPSPNIIAIR